MKHLNILKIIFKKLPKNCNPSKKLADLNFDSMSQLLLISELDEKHNIIIDPSEIGNLTTLSDLISFLDKTLKDK